MTNTTYYLKYRPQKIEELDIKNVRESLQKIVKSGKIPHAFLFSGPKGTGKTSAARILAKVVNCQINEKKLGEPCNRCDQCKSITSGTNIDVIELDAASHRGIDDVRALRDAVKLAPAKARKKVYIIDEAHMLTTEAANALLKTLEEPPEHVMFILATTNPEKLIETIRSRVTNIVFRKANAEEVERSLAKIVKGEKLKDKEAISSIAKASEGSFRDAAKVLEQMMAEGVKLEKNEAEEFLFKKKTFDVDETMLLLANKETKKTLDEIERVVSAGVSMETYITAILSRLRNGLLEKVGLEGEELAEFTKDELVTLIKLFSQAASELRGAVIEQLPAEMAVIEWCQPETNRPLDDEGPIEEESNPGKAAIPAKKVKLTKVKLTKVTNEVWDRILATMKPINTSIEALLRAAQPINFDGRVLTLGVFYRFHKERLEDGHHRRILEDVIASILGGPVRVVCTLAEQPARPVVEEKTEKVVLTDDADEDIIKVAKEIFGN